MARWLGPGLRACAAEPVLPPERVRTQLAAQRGGSDTILDENFNRTGGATLTAVVTIKPSERGRHYRLPTGADYAAVGAARNRIATILGEWERDGHGGLCPVPDEPTPTGGGSGASRAFSIQKYGMLQWGDLFTARQKATLVDLSAILRRAASPEIAALLACALDRVAMSNMSCTRWNAVAEKMQHTFGRQALPIVWDFAEVVISADAPGNWKSGYKLIFGLIEQSSSSGYWTSSDGGRHRPAASR